MKIRLFHKLFFLALGLVAAVSAILGWAFYAKTQRLVLDELIVRSKEIAKGLAANSSRGIETQNVYRTLEPLIQTVLKQKDVVYVHVLNVQGEVLASSTLQAKEQLQDELTMAALKAQEVKITFQPHGFEIGLAVRLPEGQSQKAPLLSGLEEMGGSIGAIRLGMSLEGFQRQMRNILLGSLLLVCGLLGAGLLFAFIFARSMAMRIAGLVHKTQEIGGGKYDVQLPINVPDEIGDLARGLGAMAENLEKTTVSRDYVDSIVKNMPGSLIVVSPDATIKTVNPATLELLGYEEKEIVGQPVRMIFAEEELFAAARLEKLIKEGSVKDYDLTFRAKSGEKIPVSFKGSVMCSADGVLLGIVGIARDMRVTRRLIAEAEATAAERGKRVALEQVNAHLDATIQELKLTQTQLIQSEKMAAIGQLAGGIAHELNNPLAGVLSTTQLALKEAPEGSQMKADLATIEESARRCKKIVANLLEFSRSRPFDSRPLSVLEVIEAVITLVHNEANINHVNVVNQVGKEAPTVQASAFELQQVFLNLVINAIQAMPKGGSLTLSSWQQGGEVAIKVQDTGDGIDPSHIYKIFDPFFTTKPAGKGTGLGLPICRNIIERFGGTIAAESAGQGQGATFVVTLPKADQEKMGRVG